MRIVKKIVLNEYESECLKRDGAVEIGRNGFPILIEKNEYFDEEIEESYFNMRYNITIINPFEKVVVKGA